jgi:hypothetical protein
VSDREKPQPLPPSMYLTADELAQLKAIDEERDKVVTRYNQLAVRLSNRRLSPLTDEERLEIRVLKRKILELDDQRRPFISELYPL